MSSPSITIYTTPTCAYCHMVKDFFDSKNMNYSEKDITEDADAFRQILEKTGQIGVPVIDIDGNMVVGFDKSQLQAILSN